METVIPKDVVKKVRKFIETVEALKSGKETYFSITRLTSIKSLCKDPQTAAHFAFFLAERTLEKVESRPRPNHIAPDDWEKCKELITDAVDAMRSHLESSTETTLSTLRELLSKAAVVQNYSEVQVWGRVIVTINSGDVLIIENALQCMLNPHAAAELAYRIARNYTEEYNSRYGTGLIPESVPMLEDIIDFWNSYSSVQDQTAKLLPGSSEVAECLPQGHSHTLANKSQAGKKGRRKARTVDGSFEKKYPNIAGWVQNGWIEIGLTESSHSFIRVLDEGGMIWEGKVKYPSVDVALKDAEVALIAWHKENEGDEG